jgi:hypothetical protein
MRLLLPIRASKQAPLVDEECIEPSFVSLQENSLPAICVLSTNVNDPCQPKAPEITDPLIAVTRENVE